MKELIDRVLRESGFRECPYFTKLRDGGFEKEDFVETQIQFYHAVTFFGRPMAALAAKIPGYALRLELVRNVWEEHGEGRLSKTHGATFRELLSRLGGVTAGDIERRSLWPEVRIFNTALSGACVLDEYLVGVAMMGIIERMFSEISAWLGQAIVDRGWLPRRRVVHYRLHEKLDVKHAEDFFDVLRPAWAASAENRYAIEQGLRMGSVLFTGLYDGLYRNRKRRLERRTLGPHART